MAVKPALLMPAEIYSRAAFNAKFSARQNALFSSRKKMTGALRKKLLVLCSDFGPHAGGSLLVSASSSRRRSAACCATKIPTVT